MTKQLNPNQLAEDYISAHLPFKGRSASQVLQDDTTLSSVKLWAHGLKTIGRSTKVSDSTTETIKKHKFKTRSQKWMLWKRFFKQKDNDIISKKEAAESKESSKKRRNAAIFIPDYEEEQTASNTNPKKHSLELCDLEDSGHYDMNEDKK